MAGFSEGGMFPGGNEGFNQLCKMGSRPVVSGPVAKGRGEIALAMRSGETPPSSGVQAELAAEAVVAFGGPVATAGTVAAPESE